MNISEALLSETLISQAQAALIASGSLLSDPTFLMELGLFLGVATYLVIALVSHFSSFFRVRRLVVLPLNSAWKPADLSSQRIKRRKRSMDSSVKEFNRRARCLSSGQMMYTPVAQLEA